MTARFRHSLLAGLVGIGAVGAGGGCADLSSTTDLINKPKIVQVFVSSETGTDDPSSAKPHLALTYGVHPDVNICDNTGAGSSGGAYVTCPTGLTCVDLVEASGQTSSHCVDSSGKQPQVTRATINPGAIGAAAAVAMVRVVVGELLDGKTLEQFACACQGVDLKGKCPPGADYSLDPNDCSVCGDNAATSLDESGRCLDSDDSGTPDVSRLLPGVATIDCPGTTYTNRANALGEGYYYPSGSQFVSSVLGYRGIGPAIVIQPTVPFPADSDCTVTVSSTVKTKRGQQLEAPAGGVSFHTDKMVVSSADPAKNTEDVSVELAQINITFNTFLAADSLNGTVEIKAEDGTVVTPYGVSNSEKKGVLSIALAPPESETPDPSMPAPPAPPPLLAPMTTYTVTVKGSVTDLYGRPLGTDFTMSFTTGAAE